MRVVIGASCRQDVTAAAKTTDKCRETSQAVEFDRNRINSIVAQAPLSHPRFASRNGDLTAQTCVKPDLNSYPELRSADFWSEASVRSHLTNWTNAVIYRNIWKERLLESTPLGVVT